MIQDDMLGRSVIPTSRSAEGIATTNSVTAKQAKAEFKEVRYPKSIDTIFNECLKMATDSRYETRKLNRLQRFFHEDQGRRTVNEKTDVLKSPVSPTVNVLSSVADIGGSIFFGDAGRNIASGVARGLGTVGGIVDKGERSQTEQLDYLSRRHQSTAELSSQGYQQESQQDQRLQDEKKQLIDIQNQLFQSIFGG